MPDTVYKYFDLFSLDSSQEFRGDDDGRTHRHDRDRYGERDRYGGNAGGNLVQQKILRQAVTCVSLGNVLGRVIGL